MLFNYFPFNFNPQKKKLLIHQSTDLRKRIFCIGNVYKRVTRNMSKSLTLRSWEWIQMTLTPISFSMIYVNRDAPMKSSICFVITLRRGPSMNTFSIKRNRPHFMLLKTKIDRKMEMFCSVSGTLTIQQRVSFI